MTKGNWIVVAVVIGSLVVSGCAHKPNNPAKGTVNNVDAAGNASFQNKLNVEVTKATREYNPIKVADSLYSKVEVLNSDDQHVILDAAKQPILFTAYWCPHCQRTLVLLRRHVSQLPKKPIIVAMGFAPGTTLAEAKNIEQTEKRVLKLGTSFEFYYALNSNEVKYVANGYPTLAYASNSGLQILYGEHTIQPWETALRNSERT